MRLWSIHPQLLDQKGLVACWREGLLAKHVLEGKTRGYKNHPQLIRFKNTYNPELFINLYLYEILEESKRREYKFDGNKLNPAYKNLKSDINTIKLNDKQLEYEFYYLKEKVRNRNPLWFDQKLLGLNIKQVESHPLFDVVPSHEIENWEKVSG